MQYEVDQSGKIEQTNLDTILAITNDRKYSLLLPKKEKRILEKYFVSLGMKAHGRYLIFSVILAVLLSKFKPKKAVLVDREYFGHEDLIEEKTIYTLKNNFSREKYYFVFGLVGKTSRAHELAAKVVSGKVKPDLKIKASEVIRLFETNEKDRKPRK